MNELVNLAYKALENSYSPYSGIKVGAAVRGKSGKIYLGNNIENSAYGSTICAERVAIFKAVSEGERELTELAVTGNFSEYAYPCGACRQVMSEFMLRQSKIYIAKKNETFLEYVLDDLIPHPFTVNTKGKQK
ncbi:MAG: cytidine deaminase [Clostridiales bacterium]|nr:cytidine deaminase [Clostridiales bacterium]